MFVDEIWRVSKTKQTCCFLISWVFNFEEKWSIHPVETFAKLSHLVSILISQSTQTRISYCIIKFGKLDRKWRLISIRWRKITKTGISTRMSTKVSKFFLRRWKLNGIRLCRKRSPGLLSCMLTGNSLNICRRHVDCFHF